MQYSTANRAFTSEKYFHHCADKYSLFVYTRRTTFICKIGKLEIDHENFRTTFKNHVTGTYGESIVNPTAKPDGESTAKPDEESAGKSEDYTGAIAGGITGALIFVAVVVIIVLFVRRKILRNQYLESVRVKRFRNQPPQKIDKKGEG